MLLFFYYIHFPSLTIWLRICACDDHLLLNVQKFCILKFILVPNILLFPFLFYVQYFIIIPLQTCRIFNNSSMCLGYSYCFSQIRTYWNLGYAYEHGLNEKLITLCNRLHYSTISHKSSLLRIMPYRKQFDINSGVLHIWLSKSILSNNYGSWNWEDIMCQRLRILYFTAYEGFCVLLRTS